MTSTDRPGEHLATCEREAAELDARADALRAFAESGVPHLVAGAYAFFEYTGIFRDTKDLDLFLRKRDVEDAFRVLESAGWRTERLDPVWIWKGYQGRVVRRLHLLVRQRRRRGGRRTGSSTRGPAACSGIDVLLAPPEEIIWSKGFVLERERYDGADVNHLLRACADSLDWERLLQRFDRYWEVLLLAPHALPVHVSVRAGQGAGARPARADGAGCTRISEEGNHTRPVCRGPLISRVQYRHRHRAPRASRTGGPGTRRSGAGRTERDGGRELGVPAGGGRLTCTAGRISTVGSASS